MKTFDNVLPGPARVGQFIDPAWGAAASAFPISSLAPTSGMMQLGEQSMVFADMQGMPVPMQNAVAEDMSQWQAPPVDAIAAQNQALRMLTQYQPSPAEYWRSAYLRNQGAGKLPGNIPGPSLQGQSGPPADYWYGPNEPAACDGCDPYDSAADAAAHWGKPGYPPVPGMRAPSNYAPPFSPPMPPEQYQPPPSFEPPQDFIPLQQLPPGFQGGQEPFLPIEQLPPGYGDQQEAFVPLQQLPPGFGGQQEVFVPLDRLPPGFGYQQEPVQFVEQLPPNGLSMIRPNEFLASPPELSFLTPEAVQMMQPDASELMTFTPEAVQLFQPQAEQPVMTFTPEAVQMMQPEPVMTFTPAAIQMMRDAQPTAIELQPVYEVTAEQNPPAYRPLRLETFAERPTIRGFYTPRSHPRG